MIDNEATLQSAVRASSVPRADQFSADKAFYDRIRRQFLRQSARYLGENWKTGNTATFTETT